MEDGIRLRDEIIVELYRYVSDDVIIQVEKEQKLKAPNVLHRYNEF